MAILLEPIDAHVPEALSIDLGGITPDCMAGLSLETIHRLRVQADGTACELGMLFRLRGDASDQRLECIGDFSRVHWLGARMSSGTLSVSGNVGRHAGAGLSGGTLKIAGNAGDWLAAEMSGGTVHVGGSAGDNAAGALPGSQRGLRGGMVVIARDTGCLAGARMQRGFVAIGGGCGEAAAFEMRAGTLLVGGRVGQRAGMGMQRGTLIATHAATAELAYTPPPTFQRGCVWSPPFMNILAQRLLQVGFPPWAGEAAGPLLDGVWQQWHGDMLTGGRGEIFHRPACH